MVTTDAPGAGEPPELAPLRELRRGYHDRIAGLRDISISIVRDAAKATELSTIAFLESDPRGRETIALDTARTSVRVADVDAEVLALLALQAPVARDLRVILASRDIAQTGELCMGLCLTLASRHGYATDLLSGGLRKLVGVVGKDTTELLHQADGAWTSLDEAQARALASSAQACRQAQHDFFAALLRLEGVPVEAAVDLGMAARVYERLIDHAVEIAARVLFAVTGVRSGQAIPLSEA